MLKNRTKSITETMPASVVGPIPYHDNEKYLSFRIAVMSKPEYEYSKLVELLLGLQENSKLLAAFNKDPDKVMIEAGITSEKYRSIVKTRDTLKIRLLLEEMRYNYRSRKEGEGKS